MADLPHVPPEWTPRAGVSGDPAADDFAQADAAPLDEAPRDPYEGAVPPGYDWPTHGGYLGCLLGLTAACAVAGFLGGTLIPLIAAPSLAKIVISLVVGVSVLVGLGRLGWVLGRRFYREYPQPVRSRQPSVLPRRDLGDR